MTPGYIISREGIASDLSPRINTLFSEWDRDRSPGAVIAVCRGGEVIHQRGYGVANIENDVPFGVDTVMRLGSTTKHLCATCILILEHRGELTLDDDVRRHVPEFPDFGPTITLRHLLTMTSGLWDGLNMLLFAGLDVGVALSREDLFRLYCAQRELMFRPGDDCTYSNTNYSLLTLTIERISGMSLVDFMRAELFEPLGMMSTCLTPCMDKTITNKAKGYVAAADGEFNAAYMMIELDGAGGVDSTLGDMLKWFWNYRNDEHFGPRYRARLETESRLNDGRLLDYRLGIQVTEYRGIRVVRHSGGMPGYLCDFVYYPQPDLGVILLTNLIEPTMLKIPDKIADIVLESEFDQPSTTMFVAPDRGDIAPLIGVYASADGALVVELAGQAGELVAYVLGEANVLHEKEAWLHSRKNQIALRSVADSGGKSLELRLGCEEPWLLRRIGDPRTDPAAAPVDIGSFVGSYICDEIAETHEISLQDGALRVDIESPLRKLVWSELTPIGGDAFVALIAEEPSCTNVSVRFKRSPLGPVTGLSYSINRCRDVQFRKISVSGNDK